MFIAQESASEFLCSYNYEKVLSLFSLPGGLETAYGFWQFYMYFLADHICKLPPYAGFRISLFFIRSESLDQYQSGTWAHVICKMS
jgi:hypothetical protein